MRKLVLQMGVSIDGYVGGGPAHVGDPGGPEHPDVTAWKLERLREVDLHIMGRVTYEEMSAYWPTATNPYAAIMNRVPKAVFSSSLATATWDRSRVVPGDVAREVVKLKSEPGGDIVVHGGASFVQSLSRLRLIDQYNLVIRPEALGSGLPMFKDLESPLLLELAEAQTFSDGTIAAVYRLRS
jgi:dihydrofolate reductase